MNNINNSESNIQISAKQALMLVITYVISTADVFLPAFVAQEAKADAWISVIIGSLSSLIIVNIFITLALKYPNKTIVQYSCDILGKPLGKIIGLSYVYLFLMISWAVTRELEEVFVIAFNPESPILVYGIMALIVAAYALMHGLEVIARINEILLPIGLIVLLFIAIINIPILDMTHYLPILYDGIIPPLKGAFLIQTWIVEIVIILQIMPFVKEKQKIRRYMNISIIIISIGLMAGISIIAVFGPSLSGKLLLPALEYVRIASFGPYIKNLDISVMVVWTSGIFIKIALSFYAGTLALSQLLGIKSYKSLIMPVGVLIVVFASASSRMLIEILHFLKFDMPFYAVVMTLIIPLLLLIVSKFRKTDNSKLNTSE